MKIKFPAAEQFVSSFKDKFVGKKIISFETEYQIQDVVFEEGEMLVSLTLIDQPQSPLKLFMDIERAAELTGMQIDWAAHGFKLKKA